MSAGLALPMVDLVAPDAAFAPPPSVELGATPHTGAVHLNETADEASAQLAEAAGEALQQAADAALTVLGTLSGALLAGRAALATTRVLASAAVRAAGEQRCLERQEELSALAAEQWRDAAFAAARANARRTALLARASRVARTAPGDPPPRPGLPPPLNPAGSALGDFRGELACFERALESAEAAQEAWEAEALTASLRRTDGADDWQDAMRVRRDAMLREHRERAAAVGRRDSPPPVPRSARLGDEADTAAFLERGAGILAALDPRADPRIAELAAEAVGNATRHAATNPRRARLHLKEARRFAERANQKAWRLRQDGERAAVQLGFLTMSLPEDQHLPGRDPEAEDALRGFLEEGVPLSPRQQERVRQRVAERHSALEALYVRDRCADVLNRLARDADGEVHVDRTRNGTVTLEWAPEDWSPEHWLRATLTGDAFRVVTMHAGTGTERLPEEKALDDLRCAQAQERLARFGELARELGLTVRFEMERTHGAVAGTPLAARFGERARPDDHARPGHRTVDGDGRR
ncbi:hypothetical protein ACGRHY_00525 [Streptomyces sp. HK10]|uniref:hypothetical protein n=1 Tax=Streptomyces sp. HK10 TaxID=3373255 RepID=UPI0037479D74